jgi:hypothetical protein|tara:strand:+ start:337 stop:903 length:567 start_codon:yes stop_codon:yes gene_type:complete
MTDVRLTALNPVDSQVYPVACNTSGELIVEQVDPGPDLTVTGDLTVDGSSTFGGNLSTDSFYTVDRDITPGSGALYLGFTQGVQKFKVGTDGSGSFTGQVDCSSDGNNVASLVSNGYFQSDRTAGTSSVFAGQLNGSLTTSILGDGSASFNGDITCSNNTKGLVLKSPNGTLYRLSVANDGTLSTSAV